MAALALVVGTSIAVGRAMPALETSQTPEKSEAKKTDKSEMRPEGRDRNPKTDGTAIPSVELNLVIAGLGDDEVRREIKPGNTTAIPLIYGNGKREASRQHVASGGRASVELRDVELRGAERTFTVAITVREGGQASKTFYRGFRLPNKPEPSAGGKGTSTPAFTCYLSSPSKLAKAEEMYF